MKTSVIKIVDWRLLDFFKWSSLKSSSIFKLYLVLVTLLVDFISLCSHQWNSNLNYFQNSSGCSLLPKLNNYFPSSSSSSSSFFLELIVMDISILILKYINYIYLHCFPCLLWCCHLKIIWMKYMMMKPNYLIHNHIFV